MSTDVDRQRQFFIAWSVSVSYFSFPSKANPQINASSRGIANKVVQQAIAAIHQLCPPSVGDGLIHGDAIWKAILLMR